MQIKAILISVIFLPLCLKGQPSAKYKKAMDDGDRYLKTTPTPNYDKALIEFQAAQIAARECDIPGNEVSKKLEIVFEGLIEQRKDALRARAQAEKSAAAAKVALAKAEKIINAFYFFEGKLALSIKQDEGRKYYGFIDKNGDPVIRNVYVAAEQFDYTGFAKTKRIDNSEESGLGLTDFLIDTAGHEYLVVYYSDTIPDNFLPFYIVFGKYPLVLASDLRGQQLDSFPATLFRYEALKILLLNNNLIPKLPNQIRQLQKLETLELSNNMLMELPMECGLLKELKTLNLSGNQLTDLPLSIGSLSKLRHLNVSGNKLDSLPKELSNLKSLQVLNLSSNNLSEFPAGLNQLQQLQVLDISLNPLTHFPAEVLELKNLQVLKMSAGHFNKSTINLKLLKNLHTLDISSSIILSVPSSITQLKQLRHLHLYYRYIYEEEVKRIRAIMPNCKIHLYPLLDLQEIENVKQENVNQEKKGGN